MEKACRDREDAGHDALESAIEHGESSIAQAQVLSASDVERAHDRGHGIHMPDQSWWPLFTAGAIFAAAICFVNHWIGGAIAGGALIVLGVACWAFEGPGGYYVHPDARSASGRGADNRA